MSKNFASNLKIDVKNTSRKAELWTEIIDSVAFKIRPFIVDWTAEDIILGKRWLSQINPMINWKLNRLSIKKDNLIVTLDAVDRSHGDSHLPFMTTGKQFGRLAKWKNCMMYPVLLHPSESET